MKKIIRSSIFTAAALLAFLFSSCGKLETKLLTTQSIGKSTIESFLMELDGLKAAGEGMHTQLRKFYNNEFIVYGEAMGDMLNITSEADQGSYYLFNYAMDPSYISTYPKSLWTDGWAVVTEANNILYYSPKVRGTLTSASDKATCDKLMAQAYFARALTMFDICSCYAQPYSYTTDHSHIGIPILTHIPSFDEELPRKTVAEVYSQILSDLTESRKLFDEVASEYPEGAALNAQIDKISDCYHISAIACEALLARVYLYMEDWTEAASYSRKVMDKVQLSPRNEYVAMYRQSQDNPGTESILRLNGYNTSSSISSTFDPTRSAYDFYPNPTIETYYEVDDIRKSLLTYVPESNEDAEFQGRTFPAVCKYLPLKSISDKYKQVCDIFVLRCSEMYLINAEAVLDGSGDMSAAADDIATIIARGRGIDKSKVTLLYSGASGLGDLIARERVKELCFEGHRIFDIIRRKQDLNRSPLSNASVKTVKYPDYRFILPIDQMEMQSNEQMVQNEGYPKYNGR